MPASPERGSRLPGAPIVAVAVMAMALTAAGCSTPQPALTGEVSVLGSWTGDEVEAFRAVVAPFEDRTGVEVTYEETRDLRGVLADRLASGHPPDLAGLEGPAHLAELASAGQLRDLAEILDLGAYRSRVAPTFLELGTADGHLVGVFVRTSLKGMIWYNPSVFTLGSPRTWDELQQMAARASGGETHEWCVGLASEETSGWPGTDLIEQFVLHESGVDAYDAWVAGDLPWTSAEIRRGFELYGQVVAERSVAGGRLQTLETNFRDAGEPLFADPPGCLFLHQGSFMPAFLTSGGDREPGRDFDFFPFPTMASAETDGVLGGGDLLGVLTDSAAAAELMRYLVSDEAQSLWVAQGGTLSVNFGVTDYPDHVSARAAEMLTAAEAFRFDASDRMAPGLSTAFREAVLDVTAEPANLDAVLADLEAVAREAPP